MKERESRLLDMINSTKWRAKDKEERVLNYLLSHEDEIQTLSVAQIAEKADVSKATVVRFCKSLNFNGLKDFKVWYEAGKGPLYREDVSISGTESGRELFSKLSSATYKTLIESIDDFSFSFLESFVEKIEKNERIAIYGENDSPFASFLVNKLKMIFPSKEIILATNDSPPFPLAIIISPSGLDKGAINYLSSVIISGGYVSSITGNADSIVYKASSDALVLNSNTIVSFDSLLPFEISLHNIINYITLRLGIKVKNSDGE